MCDSDSWSKSWMKPTVFKLKFLINTKVTDQWSPFATSKTVFLIYKFTVIINKDMCFQAQLKRKVLALKERFIESFQGILASWIDNQKSTLK